MSIYTENGVPVLATIGTGKLGLSPETLERVQDEHGSAVRKLESGEDAELLLGHVAIVQNPDPGRGAFASFAIGASTLDEALKDVIGAFDLSHTGEAGTPSDHVHTPRWVASTHEALAEALAEYYSCDVREVSEALS